MASPSPLTRTHPLTHKPIALSPTRAQPCEQENQPQIELPGLASDAESNEASKPGNQWMDVAGGGQIQEQDEISTAVGQ